MTRIDSLPKLIAEQKLPCLIIWIQNGSNTANRVTMTRWCHRNTDWLWIYLTSWECSVSLSKVVFFWNIWAISRLEVHSRIFECSLQRKHTAVGNKMAILVSAVTILQNDWNFYFYVAIIDEMLISLCISLINNQSAIKCVYIHADSIKRPFFLEPHP